MLEYNEIKPGKVIIYDGDPYEVTSSHVFRKQQRKPVNQTKLRNLKTGRVLEYSFGQSEKAEEADLEKKPAIFIYEAKGEYWFHEPSDKSKRFALSAETMGDKAKWLKAGFEVSLLTFEEETIGVSIPIKVELKVKEAPPDVRGNTAQGGNKNVVLENGTTISVPMFIKEGDILRINTETGNYVERV